MELKLCEIAEVVLSFVLIQFFQTNIVYAKPLFSDVKGKTNRCVSCNIFETNSTHVCQLMNVLNDVATRVFLFFILFFDTSCSSCSEICENC